MGILFGGLGAYFRRQIPFGFFQICDRPNIFLWTQLYGFHQWIMMIEFALSWNIGKYFTILILCPFGFDLSDWFTRHIFPSQTSGMWYWNCLIDTAHLLNELSFVNRICSQTSWEFAYLYFKSTLSLLFFPCISIFLLATVQWELFWTFGCFA